jgi:hypothetical protein
MRRALAIYCMTLQLTPSECPYIQLYIMTNIYFLFYQCGAQSSVTVTVVKIGSVLIVVSNGVSHMWLAKRNLKFFFSLFNIFLKSQ